MRYRWDPAYPMSRRDTQLHDADLRASDDERNAVADKLSRHYAEGRLDEAEFKTRLDTAMSATKRGDLNGLFHDLPRLPSEPGPTAAAPPPGPALGLPRGLPRPRRRRHDAVVPPVPRAMAAHRRRRLLPVAEGGGSRPLAPAAARRWTPQLGHGPLSPCAPRAPTSSGATSWTTRPRRCAAWSCSLGLPATERAEFAALCVPATAHPGQVIQAQDVPVRLWHVIVGGHAVVHRDGVPVGLLGRGDSWSEHSLLNQLRSPIAVVALSPLSLLTLSARQFFAIPDSHPVLAGRLVARSAVSADRLAVPVFNALAHAADTNRTGGRHTGQYD